MLHGVSIPKSKVLEKNRCLLSFPIRVISKQQYDEFVALFQC